MTSRRLCSAVAAVAAAALVFTATPATAAGLPVSHNFATSNAIGSRAPESPPPGANIPGCRSASHPIPVVLVHGTWENENGNWRGMSPLLKNHGYCVYTLNYGGTPGNPQQGTGDIPTSAGQLGSFINSVLRRTGAQRVDIVGHSQGGMMPRYYINFLGGARKVHALVGLNPSNHGTTLDGVVTLATLLGLPPSAALGVAAQQQQAGSSFMKKLDASGDTRPGVHYTVIATRNDEVVTPYTNAFLTRGPGATVGNITLQAQCRLDQGDHLSTPFDSVAMADVLNALDPQHPVRVPCVPVVPGVGG